MYDPRGPTHVAVEEERKTLCNEEEFYDMTEDTEKKKNISIQSWIRLHLIKLFFQFPYLDL